MSQAPAGLLRLLAVIATVGMLLVLVMGAAVTNTGSAEGCGRSWPLCNGQFIPEFTVATAIEYSHRAVSGVEGLLILLLAVVMLARWRTDREVLVLAPVMLGSLLLQAGLGAAAVMMPQSPAVLASHFGVSLIAFASTFLSSVVVFERTGASPLASVKFRNATFRLAVLGVSLYVLLVVYLGAYVRHTGVSLACPDWPLCNGQLIPSLDGGSGIVFAHRVAALGAIVLLGWLAVWGQSIHVAPTVAWLGFGLSVAQAVSGALVVSTRMSLFSTLGHAALMALLFAALSLLTRRVLTAASAVARPRETGYSHAQRAGAPASIGIVPKQ
ncbi:MAG TPA: COX15/CtaA family protein [Burkholderiaceae bacterium]